MTDLTSPPSNGPFFAVGIWRSGTSLLYALLNQHPEIGLLYEGDLPLLGPFFHVPGGVKAWPQRWEFWNGALHRHNLNPGDFPKNLQDEREATRAVYRQVAARKNARIWGDKSPTYFRELLRLAKSFPDARFLIIWRDPRAILRSMYGAAENALYFRKRGMPLRALLGFREMKRQCDELRRKGFAVHEVHYEELTKDTIPVMQGICAFLNIPFVPQMTSLATADRSAIAEGQHHANVKSEKIEARHPSMDVLPPSLFAKASRYLNFWRAQTQDEWPVYPTDLDFSAGTPSSLEILRDRVLFRLYRWFDQSVLLLYSILPIRLLQTYRRLKQRHPRRWEVSARN